MRGKSIPELECQTTESPRPNSRQTKKRPANVEKTSKRGTERMGKKWGGKGGQRGRSLECLEDEDKNFIMEISLDEKPVKIFKNGVMCSLG